jgi:WhiB family transcriptional regulator, redox-sensing transcriptional regulator
MHVHGRGPARVAWPAFPRASWWSQGACLAEDPDLFFPVGSSGPAESQIEDAKAVCARCGVRRECRTWSLVPGHAEFGVWGGLDESERQALIRNRRRQESRTSRMPSISAGSGVRS